MIGVQASARTFLFAALLLGVGLGAFVDGIVLHQLLQVHNMLSARRPPDSVINLEVNMVWDGLFHAFAWCITLAGVVVLFRAGRAPEPRFWSGSALAGAMLAGWGLFNLVEGTLNHHVLHLHHVHERAGGVSMWDWLFLASGAVMLGAGWMIVRSALRHHPALPRSA